MLVLIPCTLSSQKLVFVNGEQLIGYTQSQNDYIFKSIRQLKLFRVSDSICNQTVNNLNIIIKLKNERIASDSLDKIDLRKINKNTEEKFSLSETEKKSLDLAISGLNRDLNRQRVYKWVAIGAGVVISSYLGYKYITK
jgi:hypothetical protein